MFLQIMVVAFSSDAREMEMHMDNDSKTNGAATAPTSVNLDADDVDRTLIEAGIDIGPPPPQPTGPAATSEAPKLSPQADAATDAKPHEPRPPIKRAMMEVMARETMSAKEVNGALQAKGWLPDSSEPRAYVSYLLSSLKDTFERVEGKPGCYRVRDGVTADGEGTKGETVTSDVGRAAATDDPKGGSTSEVPKSPPKATATGTDAEPPAPTKEPLLERLRLADINCPTALIMRDHMDTQAVADYAEKYRRERNGAMEPGERPMPPCDVFRLPDGKLERANGAHRWDGMVAAGITEWTFLVHAGTFDDAARFAAT
ncbi:MAG: hypothetical protein ACRELB_09835, partial [Polyangiaceae bacterium]